MAAVKAKSPFADGRGSKVNPDVEKAMKGVKGERCTGECNPQGESNSTGNGPVPDESNARAKRMDKGLPLSQERKNGT
jgi:hypothetical protein